MQGVAEFSRDYRFYNSYGLRVVRQVTKQFRGVNYQLHHSTWVLKELSSRVSPKEVRQGTMHQMSPGCEQSKLGVLGKCVDEGSLYEL